jgi:hypothetical protein
MHCPQCGQKQVSDEMRFCNSCGFALGAVKELLATGGISPAETEGQKPPMSPRRRGVRQGAILLFIAMCLLPLAQLLGDRGGEVLPLMFLMAGMMRMLYAWIFQEGAPSQRRALTYAPPNRIEQVGPAGNRALPEAQGVPVTDFQPSRGVTKEMANPPSVTEHTTKLLNESQDHQ